ncbi:ATP-binding protein [Streptomyces sp. NPDC001709]
MSLPLTRRIARAALLVAAGAAAGVGAAGSAGAATNLPVATPNTGGLTAPDTANVGGTVEGAAQNATSLAAATGGKAVGQTLPGAAKTGTNAVKKTAPVAQKAAGQAAGAAGSVVGDAASSTTKSGLPQLPVQGGALPLG